MRFTSFLASAAVVAALATALSACSRRDAVTATQPPALLGVRVDSVGLVAAISVEVDRAAAVRVRYAPIDGSADALQVADSVSPADSEIVLPRLVPGRTYQMTVTPVSGSANGPPLTQSFTTPPLPSELANLDVSTSGTPSMPLVMCELRTATGVNAFVIVDAHGQVVWYYRTADPPQGSTRLPNGDFVLHAGNSLLEVDIAGHLVHALSYANDAHHDVLALSDSSVLFIGHDRATDRAGDTITGDAIFEWNPPAGTVGKRWTVWGTLDPATDWGTRSQPSDWLHANSLSRGPHGNFLLSLNWLDQVLSIAPDFSAVEWRLGGEHSDFTVDADAAFSGQHSVTMPAENRVLMFDNGRDRPDGSQWSRGLELSLDPLTKRAHFVWQFRPSPDNYSPFVGYTRRLRSGTTWVHFGLAAGPFSGKIATGPLAAYEVNSVGTEQFRITFGSAPSAYRSWSLDHLGSETTATVNR